MNKEEANNITLLIREIALHESERAFRSLYLFYFNRLMRFVNLYVDSRIEAEEVVSDVFIWIWENRSILLTINNFNAYIYIIAQHKSIDYCRKQHLDTISLEDSELDLFKDTITTPEEDLINEETIKCLNKAINELPTKCKIAFKLVREDKLPYKEVAQMMNISIKTLETHLSTAVKKLRSSLSRMNNNSMIFIFLSFFIKFL